MQFVLEKETISKENTKFSKHNLDESIKVL